jgi:hypothetical protein
LFDVHDEPFGNLGYVKVYLTSSWLFSFSQLIKKPGKQFHDLRRDMLGPFIRKRFVCLRDVFSGFLATFGTMTNWQPDLLLSLSEMRLFSYPSVSGF